MPPTCTAAFRQWQSAARSLLRAACLPCACVPVTRGFDAESARRAVRNYAEQHAIELDREPSVHTLAKLVAQARRMCWHAPSSLSMGCWSCCMPGYNSLTSPWPWLGLLALPPICFSSACQHTVGAALDDPADSRTCYFAVPC
jgi:hypothetical protein